MASFREAQDLSQLAKSETLFRGTVCEKAARTGLWGSGEVKNRSTRKVPRPQGATLLRQTFGGQSLQPS